MILLARLLLLLAAIGQNARAENGLVVKLYACPAGQAAATADSLRNEFGVINGVRVAADERTSRVVVQAPPEVQSRISQRLAAAFPNLQPAANPAAGEPIQSRTLALSYVRADYVETALWNVLGSRLSAIPERRDQARGYRLALSGGGNVAVWFNFQTNQVGLEGPQGAVDGAERLVRALDAKADASGRSVRLMPLRPGESASVGRAAAVIRAADGSRRASYPLAAMLYQRAEVPAGGAAAPAATGSGSVAPPAGNPPAAGNPPGLQGLSRIVNPVEMQMIEGLDVLVLRGSQQDVQQMMEIVREIERLSTETEPAIEIVPMKHIDCEQLAILVKTLYDEVYLARQGVVSLTPMILPNAIVVVGRPENVKTVKDLVQRFDQPSVPGAQFRVFHLRWASAVTAQTTIQNFFTDRGGLSPLVRVTADQRSNALIIQASARDLAQVAELIQRIDVASSESVNEVRIIRLEHSLAQDIAAIMQAAIGASTGMQGQPGQPGQGPGGQPIGQPAGQVPGQNVPGQPGGNRLQNEQRAAMLRFLMVDAKGRRLLNSGILTDVRIVADVRANALMISSPPESLDLLEAIVRQLDSLPAAEAQIKVFTIVNGDATNLSDMLKALFGQTTQGGGAGQQGFFPAIQTTASGSENSLVPLRFGVDTRTNSVIASGTMADLNVVEAILTKLDDGEVRQRKSVVIRLKNSPAQDVANTINQFLSAERQMLQQAGPGLTSAFEQIEREVVVVPEMVSNSLVLSATPRFFEEVRGIIEQLDARPPMVMIQVLIASVDLGDTHEFGIEMGLQDSVLFDRSLLSNPLYSSTTLPNGTTEQSVIAGTNTPGLNFNTGDPLGNSFGTNVHQSKVGGQGLANFAVGRMNSRLGYGGLVVSAQSENVAFLLRALAENHRVEVLQRPQIMTLDNQPAFIQVGKRVPRVTGVTVAVAGGQTSAVTLDNVGLILGVTPRISPDGLVVMQLDSEKSELESLDTGVPIYSSGNQVIRSPIIDATTAQTTVAAMSDQTVVLGGLITKSTNQVHRSVPVLGDIPLLGNLFRFDGTTTSRSELLIIMTPHIVKNEADAEKLKRAEAAKMNWCMCDVIKIYGDAGLRGRGDEWTEGEVPTIFPDEQPTGQPLPIEPIPTPSGTPSQPSAGGRGLRSPAPSPAPPPSDPSAAMQYGALQQVEYQAMPNPAVAPPAGNQPGAWQPAGAAQPAVYQAPPPAPPQGYFQPPAAPPVDRQAIPTVYYR